MWAVQASTAVRGSRNAAMACPGAQTNERDRDEARRDALMVHAREAEGAARREAEALRSELEMAKDMIAEMEASHRCGA